MFETALHYWVAFGAVLIFGEIILPGLVSVFVGLGALTVALLLQLNYINNPAEQLITWFLSSTFYIFSLRLLIVKYYPSDTKVQNIDEDDLATNQVVEVIETISKLKDGRVKYRDSTWVAKSNDETFNIGERVQIASRDNITLTVKKLKDKEEES